MSNLFQKTPELTNLINESINNEEKSKDIKKSIDQELNKYVNKYPVLYRIKFEVDALYPSRGPEYYESEKGYYLTKNEAMKDLPNVKKELQKNDLYQYTNFRIGVMRNTKFIMRHLMKIR